MCIRDSINAEYMGLKRIQMLKQIGSRQFGNTTFANERLKKMKEIYSEIEQEVKQTEREYNLKKVKRDEVKQELQSSKAKYEKKKKKKKKKKKILPFDPVPYNNLALPPWPFYKKKRTKTKKKKKKKITPR
eukprot:TRINITY_DN52190_c0_g1_i2.p2 TRINITY_DN52190_c0_g1~~TRINITY_DN52190_c0_g1_i2.p2  ORF type:complete len:152 (+),score=49.88 TRINITY_DN52190_c0_g1_i2:65-457(+)